jgi:hypothetical protein
MTCPRGIKFTSYFFVIEERKMFKDCKFVFMIYNANFMAHSENFLFSESVILTVPCTAMEMVNENIKEIVSSI